MASRSPTRRRLLWIGCLVPFLGSIALMAWYWPGALPQDSSSGVWTALAQDFAKGVFYRATVSAFGFGGTRYMPLFFVLHGALIRLAFDPVTAGIVLTVLTMLLCDVGLWLRFWGAGGGLALGFSPPPPPAPAVVVLPPLPQRERGGMHSGYALGARLWLLLVAVQDPVFLIVVAAAAVYAIGAMRARVWSLPVAYFLLTAAMTVVIFTSPGADTNHFLDLLAASVLVLGERLTRESERARLALAVPLVLAVLSAVTWLQIGRAHV